MKIDSSRIDTYKNKMVQYSIGAIETVQYVNPSNAEATSIAGTQRFLKTI